MGATLMGAQSNDAATRVAQHYATENLEERILSALEAAGKSRASLTADDLAAADEFHIGGREATQSVAAQMELCAGIKLLDIGCGIGGPARYFASAHHCHVTGIDLTHEFVRTARALSDRVGLATSVRFEQGSALDLPFESRSFDAVCMFHVGMNLSDKGKLFDEVKRILRPGGLFAIYDVMRTGPGDLLFPVPWASTANESFVSTVDDYRQGLTAHGFSIIAERQRREFAIEFFERMRKQVLEHGPRAVGLHLIMGETAVQKVANVFDALQRGAIAPVELVARS